MLMLQTDILLELNNLTVSLLSEMQSIRISKEWAWDQGSMLTDTILTETILIPSVVYLFFIMREGKLETDILPREGGWS